MELIEKYAFPALVELLLRISCAEKPFSHCGNRLGILIKKLALSVVPLVLRLRGICAPVELKIKLADPFRQSPAALGIFSEPFEKIAGKLPVRLRTIRNAVFKPFEQFNVFRLRSAAAVAVAKRHHNFIRKLLRLESLICALNIRCPRHRGVC